jgi:hypothetical protein
MKLTFELDDLEDFNAAEKALLALKAAFFVEKPEQLQLFSKAEAKVEIHVEDAAPEKNEFAVVEEKLLSLEEVRDALGKFSAEHGMTKARELLTKFGAQRISDVKEGDRAAFIKEMVIA